MGAKSSADGNPNTNMTYAGFTKADLSAGTNCVYLVDKRHTKSFTTVNSALDNAAMYTAAGVSVANASGDGLYPQLFGQDLYDSATLHTSDHIISPSLYSTISTVAFNVGTGGTADPNNYVCRVPKLDTAIATDNVKAQLGKIAGSSGTDNYIYIYIGADFTGVPAQVYGTSTLTIEMVKDRSELTDKGKPAVMQGHKITGPTQLELRLWWGSRIAKVKRNW